MLKNNLQLVLIVALSIGCGASGVMLAQERSAEAQSTGYRECFQMQSRGFSHAGSRDHLRDPEGRFPIPPGWTPVGGGPGVLWLCR